MSIINKVLKIKHVVSGGLKTPQITHGMIHIFAPQK